MPDNEVVIKQTKKWITDVVIGCNFCPFAARVIKQGSVHYEVENSSTVNACISNFAKQLQKLDEDEGIETAFVIFPNAFEKFDDYLELVSLAEQLMKMEGYDGIYQLASFHPQYLFADSIADDAANYTNRSVYPMLHLLREASIDKALLNYKNPEEIPGRNIDFARNKGVGYMKMLRDSCLG